MIFDRGKSSGSPRRINPFLFLPTLLIGCFFYCAGCQHSSDPNDTSDTNWTSSGSPIIHLNVTGGVIDLVIVNSDAQVSKDEIKKWVLISARAVSTYFGTFPVRRVRITVSVMEGAGVYTGVTTQAGIDVKIGRATRQADFEQDWVMTHEMFHLAFPNVDAQYHWIEEGFASYLEPLARARIGVLSPQDVWSSMVEGMPHGQPQPGDQGLDRTHTWGRTYWGGAMFCLLADLRIREQTHNRRSLDDAMRAILAQGGDCRHHWPLQRALEVGDRATATHVLQNLHAEMGTRAVTVDLNELWRRLGVEFRNGEVRFDDSAPLAEIRKSMSRPMVY